jgi:uncharacterized protein YndB with AHSA1/START domain
MGPRRRAADGGIMTEVTEHGPNLDRRRFPLGTLLRTGDIAELTFVRDYPYSPERIWASITDPEQTRLWWAEARIDLATGGRFDLRWLNGEDGTPLDWTSGEVTELDPLRLLEHSNSTHGRLRWRLEPNEGGTTLIFVNQIAPGDDRFIAMSLAGWHTHLDHLPDAIEGRGPSWDSWYEVHFPRWEELHAAYRRVGDLP